MLLLIFVIVVALGFDFTNGFHDSANAIATSISTRALSPRVALGMAALLNMAGAFLSQNVAATVGKGIVQLPADSQTVVLAALLGAIAWNLITWRFGIPSSSSHALVGGLVGATLVAVGTSGVEWSGIWHKVVLPMITSPAIGLLGRLPADEPPAPARVPLGAAAGEPHLPPAAAGVGRLRRPGPRFQRRPEDHGRDHAGADHVGPPAQGRRASRRG